MLVKPNIRLVVLDLDGTLLDDAKKLHTPIVTVIQKIKQQGVQFTLATGRTWGATAPYAAQLGIDLPVITYNGAGLNCPDGGFLKQIPLSLAVAQKVIRQLELANCYVKVYMEDHLFVQEATAETIKFSRDFGVPFTAVGRGRLSEITQAPLKMVVIEDAKRIYQIWKMLSNWQNSITLTHDGKYGIEVVQKSVSKGKTLKSLCTDLKIPLQQVMAIGNEGNDVEMLRIAGVGIAMGNACEELKRYAAMVTKTNEELGVACALDSYFLDGRTQGL